MQNFKNKIKRINKTHFRIAGVLLLVLLAALLLLVSNINSRQAMQAFVAEVYFEGEYRIADGDWQQYVEGEHISSTQGDVTLRGNFHILAPDGEYAGICRGDMPIAFYTNHINLTFYDGEFGPESIDVENPTYGKSSCGERWTACSFWSDEEDLIEIVVHNPHLYGNENAIDEMLSSIAFWTGIEFEKGILESGEAERNVGLFFSILAITLLGIALFSTLIHIKNAKIIWSLGVMTLFAGIYFMFSAGGVSFWNYSVVSNTTILVASMMFYMFFLAILLVCLLKSTRSIARCAVILLGVANAAFFILPLVTSIYFYDTLIWWIAVQLVVNAVLVGCLVKEYITSRTGLKWIYIVAHLPLIAFAVDVVGTWFGTWEGGMVSQFVFTAFSILAIIMVLKLTPDNINAATKATELAESRISTMMSQIRPHFIYNTLGSIEQLCDLDPKKAGELVHDFAKYLRGNFGELDNPKPILMSQEMDHVRHYVNIENVRFPDMTFTFEMNSEDFRIPALTIQPIVENAIKHGLMKLQKGGTIHVVTYETESDYCVSVVDDGVGFDTSLLLDERKHVGLRNIRERLKAMVNGSIEIDSTVGAGTRVLIKIPKEINK